MKKRILFVAIVISYLIPTYAQETLKINIEKSEIKWSGEMTFKFYGHYGTIKFSKGEFIKANNKITGGSFIIDMNTIITTDMDNIEANNGLTKHLKHTDFF